MPRIVEIHSLEQPEVEAYSLLTEAQLRCRLEPERGIFIAESPKVIKVALQKGYQPLSFLMERKHIDGQAREILDMSGDVPVYTGESDLLARITGYQLTRGVLCAMRRPSLKLPAEILSDAQRVVVIEGVVDSTNVGAIFRSAAALGMDAVLLTPDACAPLNRRAVRVSMGSVFLIPWTWLPSTDVNEEMHALGFRTAAMALTDKSVSIKDETLGKESRLAVVMGTEGDGLPKEAIAGADYVVRIPMAYGVDSLNVAAASAVAFWQLSKRKQ